MTTKLPVAPYVEDACRATTAAIERAYQDGLEAGRQEAGEKASSVPGEREKGYDAGLERAASLVDDCFNLPAGWRSALVSRIRCAKTKPEATR